jgi:hypothetical protein
MPKAKTSKPVAKSTKKDEKKSTKKVEPKKVDKLKSTKKVETKAKSAVTKKNDKKFKKNLSMTTTTVDSAVGKKSSAKAETKNKVPSKNIRLEDLKKSDAVTEVAKKSAEKKSKEDKKASKTKVEKPEAQSPISPDAVEIKSELTSPVVESPEVAVMPEPTEELKSIEPAPEESKAGAGINNSGVEVTVESEPEAKFDNSLLQATAENVVVNASNVGEIMNSLHNSEASIPQSIPHTPSPSEIHSSAMETMKTSLTHVTAKALAHGSTILAMINSDWRMHAWGGVPMQVVQEVIATGSKEYQYEIKQEPAGAYFLLKVGNDSHRFPQGENDFIKLK